MSPSLPMSPYRGTRDFLPQEMSVRQQVFHRLYDVVETYGFTRYDGPILESAEIYEAKSGREIADQQLYSLEDRGGRRLALRPEMTPSVARMIAAHAKTLQFPVRWYSHVNCHRYERPQRGRVREHWQINADIFGSESANCEIEVFGMIHDMMCAVGATRDMYVLRVNDRVLLESILETLVELSPEHMSGFFSLIDRWEKYPREKLLDDATDLGVTEEQFNRFETVLAAGNSVLDDLPPEALERSHIATVLNSDAKDLVTFDPLIVRAFEYYTSTVFEVFDADPANSRSLFGGGRYSDLVGLFSKQRIPGIGFGMGDVTLFDFLETHDLLPAPASEFDVAVLPIDESMMSSAREVARLLRSSDIRTSVPFQVIKLGKEIARADKAGAKAIVIVGPDEWQHNTVVLKNLSSGEQLTVETSNVAHQISRYLNPQHYPSRDTV